MPSESSGRLLRLGRRRIMQPHDPPLSVALKPDIGFLKVLITYHTFNGAGFDAQQLTRDCGVSARSIRTCISDNGTDSTPRPLLMKAVHTLSYCGRSSAPGPGFPFPPATSARRTAGPGLDRSEWTQRCCFACSLLPPSNCRFSSTTTPAQLDSFDRSPGRCRRQRRHRSWQW
jgi:hypothetical protein